MDPQQPTEIQSPSQPQMPTPKKSSALKWILIIFAILAVMGILVIGGLILLGRSYITKLKQSMPTNTPTVSGSPSPVSGLNTEVCSRLLTMGDLETFSGDTYAEFHTEYFNDNVLGTGCIIGATPAADPNATLESTIVGGMTSVMLYICTEQATTCHEQALSSAPYYKEGVSQRDDNYYIDTDMGGIYQAHIGAGSSSTLQVNDRIRVSVMWISRFEDKNQSAFIELAHKLRDRLPAEYR